MAPHWTGLLVVGLLVLLLFGGRGKISALMGDMAKGVTAFRKGLKDDDEAKEGAPDTGKVLSEEASDTTGGAREDERAGS